MFVSHSFFFFFVKLGVNALVDSGIQITKREPVDHLCANSLSGVNNGRATNDVGEVQNAIESNGHTC